jgi:hypothetical protein
MQKFDSQKTDLHRLILLYINYSKNFNVIKTFIINEDEQVLINKKKARDSSGNSRDLKRKKEKSRAQV